MKASSLYALLLAAGLALSAQAQPSLPALGSTLSAEEISRWGVSQPIQVGDKHYRLLRRLEDRPGQPSSLLVDAQGQVGQSHHEVIVTGISTETARITLSAFAGKALEINYFAAMPMSTLRFAHFADAARARDELSALLPQAQVGLPVQFSQRQRR